VTSRATGAFWFPFRQLPADIQRLAEEKYQLWRQNPYHPPLHFKHLHGEVWSVRVNLQYRAMPVRDGNELLWFWIGTHADYDHLLQRRP